MATRRRRVKHSHNKTRTIIKALLRKTTYKNKKNKTHRVKNNRTKKIYQSGGVPKAPKTPKAPKASAKGASGIKVEPKVARSLREQGLGYSDIEERQKKFQKENPTAEFDIPVEISGLDYNISVKSVKRKTPGQNSFSIMCGDARRFFTQVGIGKVPYHMIIGIRQKHPTNPGKKQILGFEIDLRKSRSLLFGNADDCTIRRIVKRADELTDSYYKDEVGTKPVIDEFNDYLKSLGSKMQLAPKIGNPDKKRATRLQASFSYKPRSPNTDAASRPFPLSSEDNTPEDPTSMTTGQPAPSKSKKTSRSRAPRATPSLQAVAGPALEAQPQPQMPKSGAIGRSLKPKSRTTPFPVEYFQSFDPSNRAGRLKSRLGNPTFASMAGLQPTHDDDELEFSTSPAFHQGNEF